MPAEYESMHQERIAALERRLEEQAAHIDVLSSVVTDLLALSVVRDQDFRLLRIAREGRDHFVSREGEGGTPRVSSAYFGAKADKLAELLSGVGGSEVFSLSWRRSIFSQIDELRRKRLERLRRRAERYAEESGAM